MGQDFLSVSDQLCIKDLNILAKTKNVIKKLTYNLLNKTQINKNVIEKLIDKKRYFQNNNSHTNQTLYYAEFKS